MGLSRLSGAAYADRFDGGYGLDHEGRWNERGRLLASVRPPGALRAGEVVPTCRRTGASISG